MIQVLALILLETYAGQRCYRKIEVLHTFNFDSEKVENCKSMDELVSTVKDLTKESIDVLNEGAKLIDKTYPDKLSLIKIVSIGRFV